MKKKSSHSYPLTRKSLPGRLGGKMKNKKNVVVGFTGYNGTIKSPENWKRGQPKAILTPDEFKAVSSKPGVRVKPVKCGKGKCKKLHFEYAYMRIYSGGKCKEIYVGRVPRKHV